MNQLLLVVALIVHFADVVAVNDVTVVVLLFAVDIAVVHLTETEWLLRL